MYHVRLVVRGGCTGWVWDLGGYTGWVYGWVVGRAIPGTTQPGPRLLEEQARQRSGPRKSHRGWSGWSGAADVLGPTLVRTRTLPHPLRPCRPPGPAPLGRVLLAGKGRDSDLNSIKLVKTAKCHQKVSIRPVIVPIFQNGSGKSPLGFLRFPYWPAFSHKELLGLF